MRDFAASTFEILYLRGLVIVMLLVASFKVGGEDRGRVLVF